MDSPSLPQRAVLFLKRVLANLLFRLKKTLGLMAQSLQHDELRELADEARVLGSASAESINHVGAELREINDRLSKLERDLDRIGKLLEATAASAAERDEAAAQSLSTE